MRKPIVAGNWKMNGTKDSVNDLLWGIAEKAEIPADVDVIVFPPYVFLDYAEKALKGKPIALGAQNLDTNENGAYTGEISASMLRDFGCEYVLVGHSERRALYNETNELVTEKYHVARKAGLVPVFCIGETLKEREEGMTHEVLNAQLSGILSSAESVESLKGAVIAYEPVWAIGTGVTSSPEMAQEVHEKIRFWVGERDKTIADGLRILYGGSVNSGNAKALFSMPDIDGGLIGGASLKPQDFLDIVISCNNC